MERNNKLFFIAWVIAIIAMLGSLYFSEIRHFVPCEMCWYQRILMYPLVVIIGFAALNDFYPFKYLVMTFSIIGLGFSVYHYMEQKIPGFSPVKACVGGVPCNVQYINWAGFITIPFLAGTAFLLITILMFLIRKPVEYKA
ncbi:disulfide oxidoreductase [Macrococcus equipercicus]|uniref:Disulfide bond formation protein B n=1 Tax=Macrococcus equipercicus TaxID=69967 RepID=A0A9Q9BQT7_9STAP|nr:disulfide oxidoreductase [Macrococcus equipercicus]KAA1039520.1 disulfide bond formation protein B [Macrococcus equipercicus]UTH13804.1 disulfide bond formation protein B [Macrococcus equipercicus]